MHVWFLLSECPTERFVSEFARIFWNRFNPIFRKLHGFERAELLSGIDGHIVVVLVVFNDENTTEASSLALQQLIAETKHLLVWPLFFRVLRTEEPSRNNPASNRFSHQL
jgi:hypothetical protein